MLMRSKVIRELLENGVHFGHQTNKWNPKMEKYIFGERSGIYIIDLKKTEEALAAAENFLTELATAGKTVLFAGTKKQAKQIIKEEALRCDMFFVNERWLGGCLTNFSTIRKSVERLNHLQEMKQSEIYESLSKKEKAHIDREEYKLLKNLEGIRNMNQLPDCLIVIDAEAEDIAIREAHKIGIPVIALIDTNCDPNMIDFPIPGNDDAIRSIQYIVSTLAQAVENGRKASLKGAKEPHEPSKKAAAYDETEKKHKESLEEDKETKKSSMEKKDVSEDVGKRVENEEVLEGDIKLDDITE